MKKIILSLFSFFLLGTLASCNNNSSDVKIIDIKLTNEEYAYVVKQGNIELVDSFNDFLIDIKDDGTFDDIVEKYFEGTGEKIGVEYVLDIETINDANTFVVATNCPFSPFEYVDNDGLMYGIDIEIAKLYSDLHGLNLVVKNIEFDADMEQIAYQIMKNDEKREELLDRYKYIYVDECQDVSGIQKAIITKFIEEGHRLFMVGDIQISAISSILFAAPCVTKICENSWPPVSTKACK